SLTGNVPTLSFTWGRHSSYLLRSRKLAEKISKGNVLLSPAEKKQGTPSQSMTLISSSLIACSHERSLLRMKNSFWRGCLAQVILGPECLIKSSTLVVNVISVPKIFSNSCFAV